MYWAPKFWNILAIHLLSVFSSNSELKYLTSGKQQRFVPSPGECIAYQIHRAFSEYLSDSRWISVIAEKVAEAIETLSPEHFHPPLSMDKECPIHMPPFNIVEKNPRTSSDKKPDFLKCGCYTKFGTISGLSLLDLPINCSGFCNNVTHFIYAK